MPALPNALSAPPNRTLAPNGTPAPPNAAPAAPLGLPGLPDGLSAPPGRSRGSRHRAPDPDDARHRTPPRDEPHRPGRRGRGQSPDAGPQPAPAAPAQAFELNVPRQAGPVSAPPSYDEPPGYAPDRPAGYAQDDPNAYADPSPPRRRRDSGPAADATAVFGLDKGGAATTEAAPRRPRTAPAGSTRSASRRTRSGARAGRGSGRRFGLRLGPHGWLWTGAAVAAIAAIAVVAVTLIGSGPGGPAHTLVTPARLGAFSRSTQLTKQMDVAELKKNIISQSSGQASHVVSAVYQAGSVVAGGTPAQVMLFIGGQLSGASPDASVQSFTQHFKNAAQISAGPLGGEAACVPAQASTDNSTVCAWFDNNTFGELVSPNMTVSTLSAELRTVRPSVEHVVKG